MLTKMEQARAARLRRCRSALQVLPQRGAARSIVVETRRFAVAQVETRREGIFVMPKERITIHSTYVTTAGGGVDGGVNGAGGGGSELNKCEERNKSLLVELHSIRTRKLPSV